jgi:IS5 family transposase
MSQLSFASLTPKKKKIKVEKFLNEMDKVIPWKIHIELIKPYYPKAGNGRRPFDLLLMIRIHCLQQWFNLSDPGMEAHTGGDAKSGLIHSLEITTAKVSDFKMFPSLLHGTEEAVFGDKGYASEKEKKYARDAEVFWDVLDKKKPKRKLSSKLEKRNRRLASVRRKVEFPSRVIKQLRGHKKTRYRGLEKNRSQWHMLVTLSNLFMIRGKLVQVM